MYQSDSINEIAAALNKAQGEIMSAARDGKNPFFKSTYATLGSVWEAVKDALLKNNLTLLQPLSCESGNAVVKTVLAHASGQFITSECPIVCAKANDPQALGSAITYARRYSLASMLGVVTDEDDDGEKAMNRKKPNGSPEDNDWDKERAKASYRTACEALEVCPSEHLPKLLEDARKAAADDNWSQGNRQTFASKVQKRKQELGL